MATGIDGRDLAKVVTGSVDAVGTVALGVWRGTWNLTLSGGTGVTARLQRSFNSGSTWHDLTALGQPVTLSSGSETIVEQEYGVTYQLNVLTITGGTLSVRASQ
jgi:hypothetical protein